MFKTSKYLIVKYNFNLINILNKIQCDIFPYLSNKKIKKVNNDSPLEVMLFVLVFQE